MPEWYERLKKSLNPFGQTAEAISKETNKKPPEKDKPKTFTTPAVQEKMKKDLEEAREKERMKTRFKK